MTDSELIKCSGCSVLKLASFYSTRANTGARYKCCDNCRLRTRLLEKKYPCDLCDYRAPCEAKLQYHKDVKHNKIKNFQCEQCEFKAFYECQLRDHIATAHDHVTKFECSQCSYVCYREQNLKHHIGAVHDKLKDHKCPTCPYECFAKAQLDRHIKAVHDRIKDLQCPNCDFRCSFKLNEHMRNCTGRERMSSGEFAIKGVLESLGILFEQEMRFIDCRDKSMLPFDFYLPSYHAAIEFDGKQHFEPVEYWGGVTQLEAIQKRDKIKNDFCVAKGIRLLRIKYTDFEIIQTLIDNFLVDITNNSTDVMEESPLTTELAIQVQE